MCGLRKKEGFNPREKLMRFFDHERYFKAFISNFKRSQEEFCEIHGLDDIFVEISEEKIALSQPTG